jgi:hypothetical protein
MEGIEVDKDEATEKLERAGLLNSLTPEERIGFDLMEKLPTELKGCVWYHHRTPMHNARNFLSPASVATWTLEGILEHIKATNHTHFAHSGIQMDPKVVRDATPKAVKANKNPLPLVLSVLYDTAPLFQRSTDMTFMLVEPIVDTLPKMWFGMCHKSGSVGEYLNFTLPNEDPLPWYKWNPGAGFGMGFTKIDGAGLNKLGWQPEATESQQKALLETLQANARRFYSSDSCGISAELLYKALKRDRNPADGVTVLIRDACV